MYGIPKPMGKGALHLYELPNEPQNADSLPTIKMVYVKVEIKNRELLSKVFEVRNSIAISL